MYINMEARGRQFGGWGTKVLLLLLKVQVKGCRFEVWAFGGRFGIWGLGGQSSRVGLD